MNSLTILLGFAFLSVGINALTCYSCRSYGEEEGCWKIDSNTGKNDTWHGRRCVLCRTNLVNSESVHLGVSIERDCLVQNDPYWNEAAIGACGDRMDEVSKRRSCHCDTDLCNSDPKTQAQAELPDFNASTTTVGPAHPSTSPRSSVSPFTGKSSVPPPCPAYCILTSGNSKIDSNLTIIIAIGFLFNKIKNFMNFMKLM